MNGEDEVVVSGLDVDVSKWNEKNSNSGVVCVPKSSELKSATLAYNSLLVDSSVVDIDESSMLVSTSVSDRSVLVGTSVLVSTSVSDRSVLVTSVVE